MVKKPKTVKHARSAKTGKYVTREYEKKHPSTTVVETDKVKPKPKPKK